jgi:LPXTG-motif cell wall-anchored protein
MSRNRIALGVSVAALGLALTVGTAVADDLPGNGCSVPCPSGDVLPNAEVNAPPTAPTGEAASVLPNEQTNVAPAVATVAPAAVVAATAGGSSGGLPVTGGDIAGLTAIGAVAVSSGALLVRRSRRRQA